MSTSLGEKLDKIREGAEKNIPAPARELMHRATAELQSSSIWDGVIKEGVRLPEFELPNQNGELVSSSQLLAQGPLVLTVYRGLW